MIDFGFIKWVFKRPKKEVPVKTYEEPSKLCSTCKHVKKNNLSPKYWECKSPENRVVIDEMCHLVDGDNHAQYEPISIYCATLRSHSYIQTKGKLCFTCGRRGTWWDAA